MMTPDFQLIDKGWDTVLAEASAAAADDAPLRIVCPFIKVRTLERLLGRCRPGVIQVITRFHLGEMCDGVNDTAALRLLLDRGAQIRGIRGLHAKLYLFGKERAVVTSANLTEAALLRNHEFGFVASAPDIIARCREYFDGLWGRSGPDLGLAMLECWERRITAAQIAGARSAFIPGLGDEGAEAGIESPMPVSGPGIGTAPQSFVKFFGEGDNRAGLDLAIIEEVKRSGCHWACAYPAGKRPRSVQDGAVMFMGRLVGGPNDTIIFGRAVAMRHVEGRDEASPAEIAKRNWKEQWPIYARVHHAEFLAGILANGVRLSELMDTLGADSFLSTQRNARAGSGNTDPRAAFRQQAAVQLTPEAYGWLDGKLESAFRRHGRLPSADLDALDWPDKPLAPLTET